MCLVIIYHDPDDDFPLRVFETRDENVYRPHGARAAKLLRDERIASYAEHWRTEASLSSLFLAHEDPRDILKARIVGGYDKFNGTWVAVSQENGVYAKLLIALFSDGTFGENATPEMARLRAEQGYAKRGGLCLDAVSFRSAREAADRMPDMLQRKLRSTGKRLLPNYVTVGDHESAYILHFDEHSRLHPIEIPPREVLILSIRGINAQSSVVTRNLLGMIRAAELPDPSRPDGWDSWIDVFSIQRHFRDDWARDGAVPYTHPDWRSHQHSVIQPPYLNVQGPRSHKRAEPSSLQPGDVVEWTASSTCAAADRNGRFSFLYNERFLEEGQPIPGLIAEGSYPSSTRDYTSVPLTHGF